KPFILIKGKPMIVWAMESLIPFAVPPKNFVFISLEEHQKQYQIVDQLKNLFSPEVHVLLIPEVTRGATETALMAKEYMDDEEIIISDSDHFFDGLGLKKAVDEKDPDTAGIIPVFEPPDEEVKWSYTLFDKSTRVASAVGEKDPVLAKKGAYANIGAYYFSSGNEFAKEAEEMILSGDMYGAAEKREFYIAPLYQRMISKSKKVQAAVVDFMWGLGTPKDLEYFEDTYR
ncbi:MAG: sugar phosphate nucleotidyltransferase, partial [Candidatus Roizmanbacteria bacterium]|nr:sugar phosphate nucleotidyltransferase [Candidatus Roizmanbacteria bacterium]